MSESVNLPALGESVTEGTVTRWLKQVGDHVEVDEPLLEVSTDKVDTEIPSPIAGVIEKILVEEDETVEVGAALVTIGDGSGSQDAAPDDSQQSEPAAPEQPGQSEPTEQPSAAPAAEPAAAGDQGSTPAHEEPEEPQAQPEQPAAQQPEAAPAEQSTPAEQRAAEQPAAEQPQKAPSSTQAPAQPEPAKPAAPQPTGSNAGYVTPLVRKLAHEKGIDLESVKGTGVGGRIRKQDLLAAAGGSGDVAVSAAPAPVLETSELRGTTVPMSRLRKVVADRAVVSMQTSAQLTSVVEVDVTLVAQYRDQVKAEFQQKTGLKLSFLPFFALAAAEALKAYPIINATIDGDNIVYPPQENISVAVDTERGLLTPVIRDAGALDIAGLAQEIADLAQRTRDNTLKPDELAGGTFTLTNTGSRGALFDTPIVFLPQSAILGTGIVTKKPVVVTDNGLDAIAVRSTVYLALSYDHRIVDGADAARFLVAVKNRLEGGDFSGSLGI